MYLKKIEIQGFKSFADKVTLELNKGITAVIGPNGSGKSNISDAVRWVLGEQSMKNLRGSKLEDVIFAGTENRKPLGFAEVSLIVDNSNGLLPVDYSEVSVTRRVYRSGESEFFINKTACRLKDINELFMGTGVGKDGYSIIGQGRIDEILSTKSEDRRLIFEEAAGIMKYKVRKLEAERKLEQTRQNLLRINDIIGELENQIEPLREQSETAKKFLAFSERLKVLEVNVFIDSMEKFKEKMDEIKVQIENIQGEIDKEHKIFEENQNNKKQLQGQFEMTENELEHLQQQIFNIGSSIEQSKSEIKVAKERMDNNKENNERLNLETSEFEQKIQELEAENNHKKGRCKQLRLDKDRFSSELINKEEELAKVSASIDSEQEQVEALKTEIIEKINLINDRKTEINSLKVLLEGLEKREEQIKEELQQLVLDADVERIKKEDIKDSLVKLNKEINIQKNAILELEKDKVNLGNNISSLNKKLEGCRIELSNKQSRYKFLCDLEKEHEGYSRSVKGILEERERNNAFRAGIHGALAQLITVPKEYETAVEMTMGAALQNIVTDNEESAKKAINFLKERNLGRATFLPVSVVNGKELDERVDKINSCQGFIGIASKLIKFDKKYQGVINNLLGRTVVVDNLDNGITIARKFSYSFRIVTLEGDIINTSGAMSGGSNVSKASGILGRGREIKELSEIIDRLKKEFEQVEQEIEARKAAFKAVDEKVGLANESIKEKQVAIAREEEKLVGLDSMLGRIDEKSILLKSEKQQLEAQRTEAQPTIEKKQEYIAKSDGEIEALQEQVRKLQEKFRQGYTEKDKVNNDITNIKISLSSIDESLVSLQEVIERIDKEIGICKRNIDRRQQEKLRITGEKSQLETAIEEHIVKIDEFKKSRLEKEDELNKKKLLKEHVSSNLSAIESFLMESLRKIELLKEENIRLELKKSKIEMDMENIQNKMWEDYELTFNNAMEYRKEIENIQNAQKEIAKIKNQIRDLGPVNVAAIEEYTKTKERYEFLSNQRNDLEASEDKIRKVISEMTSIMRRQFIEQFNHISKNFDNVFKELFGGGRATLELADEENILESGIDIEVQPPGKKLQSMMLLSGGEKALTAIVLLFAILKMNPSPFCILDEIEAALDDLNVYRFADYIKRFTYNTQFIIVTHRKGTMESADTLYGVTMEERGISKLVSVKMNDKAS